MKVFLGVTGASGAPYAKGILDGLVAAGAEVGVCASSAGIEVLATELYRDAALARDDVLARFIGGAAEHVTIHAPDDWKSPFASGSARVDAYVVCPCSMSTVGTLASGAMTNLIHRAASVALKERRKLVLVPRETPLSSIHLRGLATLNDAGAVVLFAAPGFYHGADSVQDLVDFVVSRCLDQLGVENALVEAVGRGHFLPSVGSARSEVMSYETGSLAPGEVRRLFDRIAPVYDAMNRVMTAGLDRSWRRLAVEAVVQPGDRVLDACCGTGDLAVAAERDGGVVTGLDFSPRMLERARRKSATVTWVEGDLLALPFEDGSFDAATVGFGVRNVADLGRALAELRRVLRPGGRLAILEITRPRGILRPFFSLWFDRLVPLLGRVLPGGSAYTYLPASVRRFPGAEELVAVLEAQGFEQVRFRLLGGTIVALHTGVRT